MAVIEDDAKKAIESQWAALKSSLKSALPSQMAGLARDAYVLGAEAAAIGINIDVSSFVEAAEAKSKEYDTKVVLDRTQDAKREMEAKEAAEKQQLETTQKELKAESTALIKEHEKFIQNTGQYLGERKKESEKLDKLTNDLEAGKPVDHKALQEALPIKTLEEEEKQRQERKKIFEHHNKARHHHSKAHKHNETLVEKADEIGRKINANLSLEERAILQAKLEEYRSQLRAHEPIVEKAKEIVTDADKKVKELEALEKFKEEAIKAAQEGLTKRYKDNPAELQRMQKYIDKCQQQDQRLKGEDKDKKVPAVKTPLEKEPSKRFGNITKEYKVGKPDNIDPPPNTPPVAGKAKNALQK